MFKHGAPIRHGSLAILVICLSFVMHSVATIPNVCGRPHFDNMSYDGPIMRAHVGTSAIIQCRSNHHERSFLVTCQNNGKWSEPDGVCTSVTCPLPELKPNSILDMSGRGYNDTATFECTKGFWYNGTNTMRCQRDGTWTYAHGKCDAVTCDAIGIQNGKMEYTHFDYMGMASVTCNEGYAYDKPDSKIRHCIANNVWSGESGSCEVIRCPKIRNPENGQINYGARIYGSQSAIKCNQGYTYSKPASITRTCLGNNTWTGEEGTCDGTEFYLWHFS